MKLISVTFEPTDLLGGDQFAPQDVDSTEGRSALADQVFQVIDLGAAKVTVAPST